MYINLNPVASQTRSTTDLVISVSSLVSLWVKTRAQRCGAIMEVNCLIDRQVRLLVHTDVSDTSLSRVPFEFWKAC